MDVGVGLLGHHGVAVARALARARLTHNKKKTVVSSSKPHIGQRVVALMKVKNVHLKVVRGVRDLGLDGGGGLKRVTTVQTERSRKAVAKLSMVAGLVRSNRVSTRRLQTGAHPTRAYGAEAYGLTAAAACLANLASHCALLPHLPARFCGGGAGAGSGGSLSATER